MGEILFHPNAAVIEPDAVLKESLGRYRKVIILGWDHNGDLSSRYGGGITYEEMLWLLEREKLNTLLDYK